MRICAEKKNWQLEVEDLKFEVMYHAAHRMHKDLLTSELVEFFREVVQVWDIEDNNPLRDFKDSDIEKLL